MTTDKENAQRLHTAILGDDTGTVMELLKSQDAHKFINMPDDRGYTPLASAIVTLLENTERYAQAVSRMGKEGGQKLPHPPTMAIVGLIAKHQDATLGPVKEQTIMKMLDQSTFKSTADAIKRGLEKRAQATHRE